MKHISFLLSVVMLLGCVCLLASCGPASMITADGYEFLMNEDGETYAIKSYDNSLQHKVLTVPAEVPGKGYLVTEIRQEAFWGNTVIEEVTISTGITKVDGFNNCSALKTVSIPASVTDLSAFSGCSSLENVNLSRGVKNLSGFANCTALKTIEIPDTVTTLGNGAFLECESLQEVILPEGVIEIGDAFGGCASLQRVTIPSTVTTIGDAFENCTSLQEIRLPDGVLTIGRAFRGCENLQRVYIPATVTKIDNNAFDRCYSLSEVHFGGTMETWNSFGLYFVKCPVYCSDGTVN